MSRRFRSVLVLIGLLVLPISVWAQNLPWRLTRIPAPDHAFGLFGTSVALSGDTLVIGGLEKTKITAVLYVYVRDGDGWSQQARLTIANPHGDNYPPTVAVDGDTMVVGLPFEDVHGVSSGAVHIYSRLNGVWARQARVTASDRGAQEFFGYSAAVSGDTIAVGAIVANDGTDRLTGAVYVFRWNGRAWKPEARLCPKDLFTDAQFGTSVSLAGDRLAVGAPRDGDAAGRVPPGSVRVFVRHERAWRQEARLAGDPDSETFGQTVSLAGDTLAAGAFTDRAFVFKRRLGAWTPEARLTRGEDPAAYGFFGPVVATNGNLAVVWGDRRTPETGPTTGAYLFRSNGHGAWNLRGLLNGELRPYGPAIAMEGDTIVLGSPRSGDSGEVDVYQRRTPPPQR
jgi:hypothetical protein